MSPGEPTANQVVAVHIEVGEGPTMGIQGVAHGQVVGIPEKYMFSKQFIFI